ncbi:hypothetical protein H0266_11590 [Halobacillus locisalis]|uniref:Uncharacterized protein n=1 Tax=Halobacillus locisalis TaxID=220753 RepID=A0A838CV91_9BACI|nr:hypothetical protein [Halobacillus locisalis]
MCERLHDYAYTMYYTLSRKMSL